MYATVNIEIPVDMIYLTVSLRAEAQHPKKANEIFKDQEKKLLDLISEYDPPDSNISFKLLNLSAYTRKKYKMRREIGLPEQGIDRIISRFTGSKIKGLKERGQEKAWANAKKDAESTACAAGKRLGKVIKIETESSDKYKFDQSLYSRYAVI